MKKSGFLICVITFLFVSCSNFVDGSSLKQQLEEEIDFYNGNNASVKFTAPAGTGAMEPAGNYTYRLGTTEEIIFTPVEKYSFYCWGAFDEYGNLVSDSIIHFENPSSPQSKVTFRSKCEKVTIEPVTYITQPSLNYNPLDLEYKVSFTNDNGQPIEMMESHPRDPVKVFRTVKEYKNSISKEITFTAEINSPNSYKRLYLEYESGEVVAETLVNRNKNDKTYKKSFTLEAKDITRERINFGLEDFYGNKVKLVHDAENPDTSHKDNEPESEEDFYPLDIFRKSPVIKEWDCIQLSQLEPFVFKFSNGNGNCKNFYLEGEPFYTADQNVRLPNILKFFFRGFNPETANPLFLDNLTFNAYGGTDKDNLTLIENCKPQWNSSYDCEVISLSDKQIDASKDYYLKTVVKADTGEELSSLWCIKPSEKISKTLYDGSKYYLSVSIPEGLYGKKWKLYRNGTPLDEDYVFPYKENEVVLESLVEGETLCLKLNEPNVFCSSNELIVTFNNTSASESASFIEDVIAESGKKSSGKYKVSLNLNSAAIKQNNYVKYVVRKENKLIASVTNENPVFEISCDDLIELSKMPLTLYAEAENGTTHIYEITYNQITFINEGINEGKKTGQSEYRASVLDLTPPDCANSTFTADAYNFYMTLPVDLITKERDGRNQYLSGAVYFVPFKSEWESCNINEIPVTEEIEREARSIKAHFSAEDDVEERVQKYFSSDEEFRTFSISRRQLEKYEKVLIFMKMDDCHGNKCNMPVFVYETRDELTEGIVPFCYNGHVNVYARANANCDPYKYFIAVPVFNIDVQMSAIEEAFGFDLQYASDEILTEDSFERVKIYYKQIIGNRGVFSSSPYMYIYYKPLVSLDGVKYDYLKFENGSILFHLEKDLKACVEILSGTEDYGDSLVSWEKKFSAAFSLDIVTNMDFYYPNLNNENLKTGDYYIIAVYWPDGKSQIIYKGRKL